MTHPPNKANSSLPSTLQHEMLPLEHTLHVEELRGADFEDELVTSNDFTFTFPLVVQVSKVHDLKAGNKYELLLLKLWKKRYSARTHTYIRALQAIKIYKSCSMRKQPMYQ